MFACAGGFKEYETLLVFRNKLIHVLSATNVFYKLILTEIITATESEEIANLHDLKEKISFLVKAILKSLESGVTQNFYMLLSVMEGCRSDIAVLAEEIRSYLVHDECAGIRVLLLHFRIQKILSIFF